MDSAWSATSLIPRLFKVIVRPLVNSYPCFLLYVPSDRVWVLFTAKCGLEHNFIVCVRVSVSVSVSVCVCVCYSWLD